MPLYPTGSAWFWNPGPSLSSQASKQQTPGPKHRSRTCQLVERSGRCQAHFRLPLRAWPREVQEPGRMSLEQFLSLHPQSREGPLTPATGEKSFSVFFFSKHLCILAVEQRTLGPRL